MTKSITKSKKSRTRSAKTSAASNNLQPGETKRPGGKLGLILDRLDRKAGATVNELVETTGWQKHSVRGALSRLRTHGFAIQLEAKEGRKAYRLMTAEG